MENINVSVEYTNNNGFKGIVLSRSSHGHINFYTMTKLNGSTFSTFDQADKFMGKLGYYKLGEAVNTNQLAPSVPIMGLKAVLDLYEQVQAELL